MKSRSGEGSINKFTSLPTPPPTSSASLSQGKGKRESNPAIPTLIMPLLPLWTGSERGHDFSRSHHRFPFLFLPMLTMALSYCSQAVGNKIPRTGVGPNGKTGGMAYNLSLNRETITSCSQRGLHGHLKIKQNGVSVGCWSLYAVPLRTPDRIWRMAAWQPGVGTSESSKKTFWDIF